MQFVIERAERQNLMLVAVAIVSLAIGPPASVGARGWELDPDGPGVEAESMRDCVAQGQNYGIP